MKFEVLLGNVERVCLSAMQTLHSVIHMSTWTSMVTVILTISLSSRYLQGNTFSGTIPATLGNIPILYFKYVF